MNEQELHRHLAAWASGTVESLHRSIQLDAQHEMMSAEQSDLLAQAQRRQAAHALRTTITTQRLVTAAVWLVLIFIAMARGGFLGFLMLLFFSFVAFLVMVNIPIGSTDRPRQGGN